MAAAERPEPVWRPCQPTTTRAASGPPPEQFTIQIPYVYAPTPVTTTAARGITYANVTWKG